MIRFKSKIFEEITVEGLVSLNAERKFRALRNFDLKIHKEEKLILTVSTITNFLKVKFNIIHNLTDYKIHIENDTKIQFDNEFYELNVERMYPFKKKYADVSIDDQIIGEIIFEKKLLNVILDFIPKSNFDLKEETAIKIAILTILNIADLDGSE